MAKSSLPTQPFPEPPSGWERLSRRLALIGPGIVLAGLEVGAGEMISCAYAGALAGMGFAWAILLSGIVKTNNNWLYANYTLCTGESPIRLFDRLGKWLTAFWTFFYVIYIIWWYAGALKSLAGVIFFTVPGMTVPIVEAYWFFPSIAVALLTFVFLAFAKWIYGRIERWIKYTAMLLTIGVTIYVMVIMSPRLAWDILVGLFRFGYIPPEPPGGGGILVGILITIMAWGFGGGPEESQKYALYVRERNWGMAKIAGRVTGIPTRPEDIPITGFTPTTEPEDLKRYAAWKKCLNTDLWIVYFPIALWGALMWMIAATHTFYYPGVKPPVGYLISVWQAEFFAKFLGYTGLVIFLGLAALNLWDSYLCNFDAYPRMIGSALRILSPKRLGKVTERKYYLIWLAIYLALTIPTMWVAAPLVLLVICGILGALCMAISFTVGLIGNLLFLPKEYRPKWYNIVIAIGGIIFYVWFCSYAIPIELKKLKLF